METTRTPLINQDVFLAMMKAKLNAGMVAVAEPILKKAVAEMETAMRKELGAMIISFIDTQYEVDRMDSTIRIIVKNAA